MRPYGIALRLLFAYGAACAGMNRPCMVLAADGPEQVRTAAEPAQLPVTDEGNDATQSSRNPLWALPISELSATRSRPIFSPSRRPPTPRAIPAATPPAPKPVAIPREADRPPLSLVGTIVGESLQIAIVLEETTNEAKRLKAGDEYNGWVLRSVAAREAEFRAAHRSAVLVLSSRQAPATANPTFPAADSVGPAQHRKR